MQQAIKFKSRALPWLLLTALLAATPLMAQTISAPQTANGPYIGIEGGVNWEAPQDYRFDGSVVDRLHFDRSWAAGVIGGYLFANGLRPELELDARRNSLTHDWLGRDTGHDDADTAMANLWYEFKASSGVFSVLHPYLGVGAGAVRSWYGGNPTLGGIPIASAYSTEFAYQVGAGVGYAISRHFSVSFDYRRLWSDKGDFHHAFGMALPADEGLKQHYGANTAMLSVRYTFGSAPAPIAVEPPPPPEPSPPQPPPPPSPVVVTPPPCHPPAGFQVDANCHIIEQNIVLRAVDFQYTSARLTAAALQTLDDVAAGLLKQPALIVEIQGYTDSRGSVEYNLRLSQLRADAVKSYLISKGVTGSSLTARGYGKADPIATNATLDGRAQNRRVAFVVTNAPEHVQVRSLSATPASTEAAEQGGEHHGSVPQQ